MDFYQKYLKYKNKYLRLKDLIGGGIQFDKFMYDLALENHLLFNLENYIKPEYSPLTELDLSLLESYMEKKQDCSHIYMEFLHYLYKHTKFIDVKYIIAKLQENLNELNTKYKDYVHILCIPNNNNNFKSNFYFILYFIHHYQQKFKKHILIYEKDLMDHISHKDQIITAVRENKALFIFCDDMLYSGRQITEDIILSLNNIHHVSINIYLNIFGFTELSLRNILDVGTTLKRKIIYHFQDTKNEHMSRSLFNLNIYFPHIKSFNNSIEFLINKFLKEKKISFNEFFRTYNIFILREGKIISELFQLIQSGYTTHLIYLFYKFPDGISTYAELCKMYIYGGHETVIKINDLDNSFVVENNSMISFMEKINTKYQSIDRQNRTPYKLLCTDPQLEFGHKILFTGYKHNPAAICEDLHEPFYKKIDYFYEEQQLHEHEKFAHLHKFSFKMMFDTIK